MAAGLATQVSATVVLWAVSGFTALAVAAVLALGSLSTAAARRRIADALILLSRGMPTSLLVITAGLAALPHRPPRWLPNPFPGTSRGMTLLAWAVTIALAAGSAGHLAVIFRSGYRSLGAARLAQLTVLAMPARHRVPAVAREAAAASLAPTGARMVHHLHNTAFAALFPVADLFGWIQQRSYETFAVTRYAATGAAVYITLSLLIWGTTRGLERRLRGIGTRPRLLDALR